MSKNISGVTSSTKVNDTLLQITKRIIARSKDTREAYLAKIERARSNTVHRAELACGNLAHGFAACQNEEKSILKSMTRSDIAIINSYNDMLSAHRPYDRYPDQLKQALLENGAIGQVAAGVPAMCDGVTQGQDGMELSLLSRDVIAMSTAIGLSHNMFDGALYLGICDKIVPGLMMGALSFGHLPAVFVPAGPMSTGLPNKEKVKVRQLYVEGKVDRNALLEAEAASYHSIGTCTFYGTANSNQMVMEVMGLHLPGASFVPPDSPLRDELTRAAARQITRLTEQSGNYLPIGKLVDEKVIVNGIVALLATGGSTNLTMHLVAIARAAGIIINWDDFSDLSAIVPLICRIYPNGQADINQFQAAGGVSLLIRQLLAKGLLHDDVHTIAGFGLSRYTLEPWLDNGQLAWREGAKSSYDLEVIADIEHPFSHHGGTKLLSGNLGRAVMKTSAVPVENQVIEAPAIVFNNQNDIAPRFEAGELDRDCVIVVRFQGPSANGMPELHKLMPPLGVLLDKGYKVALVTDGRLSGASGKVPSAIHVTPEAYNGGLLAKVQDGDLIRVNALTGEIELLVDKATLSARQPYQADLCAERIGCGRELFGALRQHLSGAEEGACSINF
ncbi:phosphogluconate dehydratase [Providencia alcalifaciens]|uniref:Phosphogluconate dehydratase n=1 Tax=Providencia alcalifaciens DSM 30120 TaxID=520999 RepID=B6XE68_9GAMM|nr:MULTISPECIES: phosphogluconate dehydratase [Providencia]ATG15274.1 phosphogluconate dehydratase [Providencia alcalifaciens]EEB46346.1 phosphogluconate dehydratase [Providencia alcalifaciens DSM 30120]EKT62900.1 phosphogluconate dehydratase [Providencia alcalifaciens Dmel2]EUD04628.1 phosphogluconate dehydratase [Providencia alcalifaciens RIMD 1656011]MTC25309.1 phosphogluconate dehydratase [Providencia alcalifaciens]